MYICYQDKLAVYVADSREQIEAVCGIEFDRIEEVKNAEMVNGVVLIGDALEDAQRAAKLEAAKAERAAAVAALTVEVDGMVFDGDEKAQERMARSVLMAESPEEQMEWVLADSSVAVVTAEQLRRACRAAGKAMGALWVVPYKS